MSFQPTHTPMMQQYLSSIRMIWCFTVWVIFMNYFLMMLKKLSVLDVTLTARGMAIQFLCVGCHFMENYLAKLVKHICEQIGDPATSLKEPL